jgi:16S rRNA (cytosine967-C5)-methyltransferase
MTMRASPGRVAACRALLTLDGGGGRIDDLLGRHARDLDGPERRLAWALVLGVERHRRRLDHQLQPHLSRPMARLDPEVRVVLRAAALQVLDMDRIPDHAAVHQAVELTRVLRLGRAGGMVNAALRSLLRAPGRCGAPTDPGVAHSLPPWLMARLAPSSAAAFNVEAPLGLRPREPELAARLQRDGIEICELDDPLALCGAVLVHAPGPTGLPGWPTGGFAVQDAAAQAVVRLVAAQPGERILDACAAPGGKALALADAVGEGGIVVAVDRSKDRLAAMDGERRRLGVGNVEARVADATAGFDDTFDRVLVDAPCSALGTLRRHPEVRWQRREQDLAGRAERQRAILEGAATGVRPGGTLVYAVCSFAVEEGIEVADGFLGEHAEFRRQPIEPGWAPARTVDGDFASLPDQGPWDGFFACVMRKADRVG